MQTDSVSGEMAISESSTYLTGNPGKCHSSIWHGSCILIAVWARETLATISHRSKSTPEKERGRGGGEGEEEGEEGRRRGRKGGGEEEKEAGEERGRRGGEEERRRKGGRGEEGIGGEWKKDKNIQAK